MARFQIWFCPQGNQARDKPQELDAFLTAKWLPGAVYLIDPGDDSQ